MSRDRLTRRSVLRSGTGLAAAALPAEPSDTAVAAVPAPGVVVLRRPGPGATPSAGPS